jgi:hypothetical protein
VGLILIVQIGRAAWEACSSSFDSWEPSKPGNVAWSVKG